MSEFRKYLDQGTPALFTDLYELTMMQSYFYQNMNDKAVFSLFVRKLPPSRNFLLSAGLEDVLDFLEDLRFSKEDIEYLDSLNIFHRDFLKYLSEFRFSGDVYALPEGTPFFANEPLLEIIAPIQEAQLLETYLLNQMHFQTLAASKAARIVNAAKGIPVIDFGLRRIHGYDAGIKAARSFYIAGVQATSNVLAGRIFNIPVSGTMAHSLIQAYDKEIDAFKEFALLYPKTILLVDTYDTMQAIEKIIELSRQMGDNFQIQGVRIDSSDLCEIAGEVRTRLASAGLEKIKIFASGGLDEYKISELLKQNTPLDGLGVGTKMGVSEDVPYLDLVYKMTSYACRDSIKLSSGKETLPGKKQIFRQEEGNHFLRDTLGSFEEELPGRGLLLKVMENGKKTRVLQRDLNRIRQDTLQEINKLPPEILKINSPIEKNPVQISDNLRQRHRQLVQKISF